MPQSLNPNAPQIQTGSVSRKDFRPSPIEPSWILEGNPTARSVPLASNSSDDFSCGLWECTAGKFKYIFPVNEIVQILEGEVFIEEDGAEYRLRAGETAHFPQGLTTYWTVPRYVKKFAVFHTPNRSLMRKITGKIKMIAQQALAKVQSVGTPAPRVPLGA